MSVWLFVTGAILLAAVITFFLILDGPNEGENALFFPRFMRQSSLADPKRYLDKYINAMNEHIINTVTLSEFLQKERLTQADIFGKNKKKRFADVNNLKEQITRYKEILEKEFLLIQSGQIVAKLWFVVDEYKKAVKHSLEDAHEEAAKTAEKDLRALPCLTQDPSLWEITKRQFDAAIRTVNESLNKNESDGIIEQTSIDAQKILVDTSDDGFLGRGGFGTVRRGFIEYYGAVAIKVSHLQGSRRELVNNAGRTKIVKELKLLHLANHNNVVRVFGYTTWKKSVALIMEYMQGESLHDLLLSKNKKNELLVPYLPEFLCLRICYDISNGVSYLHFAFSDQRITHGDLKPRNVLLTSDLRCKIADFGGADIATVTDPLNVLKNNGNGDNEWTQGYTAPERIKNSKIRVSKAMDIFSVGMIFFVTMSREKLRKDVTKQVNNFFQSSSSCEQRHLKKLTRQCINQDPEGRPNALKLREELKSSLHKHDFVEIAQQVAYVLKAYKIHTLDGSSPDLQTLPQCFPIFYQ